MISLSAFEIQIFKTLFFKVLEDSCICIQKQRVFKIICGFKIQNVTLLVILLDFEICFLMSYFRKPILKCQSFENLNFLFSNLAVTELLIFERFLLKQKSNFELWIMNITLRFEANDCTALVNFNCCHFNKPITWHKQTWLKPQIAKTYGQSCKLQALPFIRARC